MQLGVDAVEGHELVVSAVFGDDAAFDHDDLVGVADGAEAMGDGDDGLALHQLFERVDDEFFGFAVERGGGLVEQEDGAVADHDAGDADALALAAGEGGAALADEGVVAERHGEMNSSALASFAAAMTSSFVAAGRPKAMLSKMVPRKRTVSCRT